MSTPEGTLVTTRHPCDPSRKGDFAMPTERPREPPQSGYLTMQQLADYLNVKLETLRDWRKLGYGPLGVKVGHGVRYSWKAIRAYEAELVAEEKRRQGEVA